MTRKEGKNFYEHEIPPHVYQKIYIIFIMHYFLFHIESRKECHVLIKHHRQIYSNFRRKSVSGRF